MPPLKLDESDKTLLVMALRIAADQFRKDKEAVADQPRLVAQFDDQISQAGELADQIEEADEIQIITEGK